jgi:hypothetical protein
MTATIQKRVLINARALIEDPCHWTQETLARTTNGQPVAWHKHSASKWCALGALYRAAYSLVEDKKRAVQIGDNVADGIYPRRWLRSALHALNDRQGHAAVLAVFDRALAKS